MAFFGFNVHVRRITTRLSVSKWKNAIWFSMGFSMCIREQQPRKRMRNVKEYEKMRVEIEKIVANCERKKSKFLHMYSRKSQHENGKWQNLPSNGRIYLIHITDTQKDTGENNNGITEQNKIYIIYTHKLRFFSLLLLQPKKKKTKTNIDLYTSDQINENDNEKC